MSIIDSECKHRGAVIVNIWHVDSHNFRISLWLPSIPWWLSLRPKKLQRGELNGKRQKVLCLTLPHFDTDWPHWMESEASPRCSVPEDRVSFPPSVQLLPAGAVAAAPLRPPSPRYLASPSLGPHSRCRSPRLRCRPPIIFFVKRSFVSTFLSSLTAAWIHTVNATNTLFILHFGLLSSANWIH